jgi:hypothetical protein
MSVRAAPELASLDIDIPQNVRSPIPSLKPRSPPNVRKEKMRKKEKARPRSITFYRPVSVVYVSSTYRDSLRHLAVQPYTVQRILALSVCNHYDEFRVDVLTSHFSYVAHVHKRIQLARVRPCKVAGILFHVRYKKRPPLILQHYST